MLTREDETKLAEWLASEICPVEMSDERAREALLARCRAERIEPPGRPARLIAAARATFEQQFCERTVARLSPTAIEQLEDLVAEDDQASADAAAGRGAYAELKADPGQLGLDTLLRELAKLERIRTVGLPDGLFTDASEKLLASWKARAASEYPAWMRAHPPAIRVTLLASLCWVRAAEITDSLVELLIALVHKINAHAERRVEKELVEDLKRVRGKESILFALAEAAVEHPDETIRRALFPVVAEGTLRNLVSEAQANKNAFDKRVRTVLRSSYSNHYRRGLPKLLAALEFRGNNTPTARSSRRSSCSRATPNSQASFSTTRPASGSRSTASFRHRGVARSSTPTGGPSGSHTSCACSTRCATRSAAARSGSSAPAAGATPSTISRATSSSTAMSTTPRCASQWTRPPSSRTSRTA